MCKQRGAEEGEKTVRGEKLRKGKEDVKRVKPGG